MCSFAGNRKSRVVGDAAVGEEAGRVGENQVEHTLRVLASNGVHDLQAVAVVEVEPSVVVAVGELARLKDLRALLDDGVFGLPAVAKAMAGSSRSLAAGEEDGVVGGVGDGIVAASASTL